MHSLVEEGKNETFLCGFFPNMTNKVQEALKMSLPFLSAEPLLPVLVGPSLSFYAFLNLCWDYYFTHTRHLIRQHQSYFRHHSNFSEMHSDWDELKHRLIGGTFENGKIQ